MQYRHNYIDFNEKPTIFSTKINKIYLILFESTILLFLHRRNIVYSIGIYKTTKRSCLFHHLISSMRSALSTLSNIAFLIRSSQTTLITERSRSIFVFLDLLLEFFVKQYLISNHVQMEKFNMFQKLWFSIFC